MLPYAGLQFKILSIFGEALPLVAGGMAVVGAVMFALSFRATAAAHDSTATHK